MIFKNAQVIAFTKPFTYTIEELNEKLAACKFMPLEEKQISSIGWVNPLSSVSQVPDDYYLASTAGVILLKYYVEKKDIKPSTIKKRLDIIETEMIKNEKRSLTKREKIEHTEEIILELLPHAQTIEKSVMAYLSPKDNILVVNTTTDSDTESICALLRKSIGSLPSTRVSQYILAEKGSVNPSPESVFTEWVVQESPLPPQLFIGESCAVASITSDSKAKASFKEQDIQTEEIKQFIENTSMEVKELSLILYEGTLPNFETVMSFTVNKNLDLKSLKIFDNALAKNPFNDAEEGAELNLFEGDFLINVKYINLAFSVIHNVFKTSAKACIDESLGTWETLNTSLAKLENYFSVQLSQIEVEQEDTLIEEAKQFIITNQSFSISALQRKFRIGYNRAARLVELAKITGVEVNGS